MAIWKFPSALWRNLFRKREVERELDEELGAYVELLVEEKIAQGMEPAAARRSARMECGGLERVKQEVRDVRAGRLLEDIWTDAMFALRTMARRPVFAGVVILTLGLGLAVNMAIFCVFNAVLLRPLPYRQPERLVHVFETSEDQNFSRREASYPDFLDLRDSGAFAEVAGYNGGSVTLSGVEQADRVAVLQVTDNFFEVLGVKPASGRGFLPGESGPEGASARVLALTDGSWRRRFGADAQIVGRTLQLNGSPFTVVGVLPASFEFPLRGGAEFVLPLAVSPAQQERRYWHWLDVIARLKPGRTRQFSENEISNLARRFSETDPKGHEGIGLTLVPLHEEIVGSVRPALGLLMGAVGLVLLIVCANVAGLMLTRSMARRREMGIRAALGAGRARLARLLVTETAILGLLSGVLGMVVAPTLLRLLTATVPERQLQSLPHLRSIGLDQTTWLLGLGLALLSGAALGLASSWRTLRLASADTLQGGRSTHGSRQSRVNQALVVAEVALAVVLLVGAGLLTRSFLRLQEVSPGFDTEDLLTMRVSVPGAEYEGERLALFHRRLLEDVGSVPGVRSVAAVSQLPLTGRGDTGSFRVVGGDPARRSEVNIRFVSPNYFSTLGIPLLEGRGFDPTDIAGRPGVVLANQLAVRRIFGGDALGQRIVFPFFDGEPEWEIVGMVGDEMVDHLAGGNTPVVYFSMRQVPLNTFSLLARVSDDSAALEKGVRQAVRGLDAQVPVYDMRTMRQIVAASSPIFVRRYLMSLMAAFAGLALFLASLGIYGVLTHFVRSRHREIAIRMAFGADRARILRLIAGRGMGLAALGAVAGLIGALILTRTLRALLFEVSPADPLSLVSAVFILAAVALTACGVPALRASRIDPTSSLRED